uniref:Uncharacterized protein n=1 Tax=Anguilla anguilla TaxID=7936 RepID=A0A0E9UD51_ANGAN
MRWYALHFGLPFGFLTLLSPSLY